jgi:predicted nucleotidyltransferase
MAKTALELTPVEMRRYRLSEAVERREKAQDTAVDVRKREAWDIAGTAAQLLRKEFGAQKVVVFGSLAHEKGFGLWSDIDLGAWGIPPEKFYSAVAAVTGLSSFFKVDLVDVAECRPTLQKVIEEEGIEV